MNDKAKWTIVSSLGILVDVLRFKVLQLKKEKKVFLESGKKNAEIKEN